MKTRKKTSWMPHPDVSVDAAFSNQVWMADVLRRLGLLDTHCYGAMANGAPDLSQSHCQYRAVIMRRRFERDAFMLLSKAPKGCISVMFTAVAPGELQKRPFKQSELGSFRHYITERLKRSEMT